MLDSKTLGLYLGCEVMTYTKLLDGFSDQKFKAKLISVSCDGFVHVKLGEGSISKLVDEVKLLLRSLETMTEEEKWGLNQIIREARHGKNLLPYVYPSGGMLMDFINLETPKMILYLLSKGFDLFGLIEKGEAIDVTKI